MLYDEQWLKSRGLITTGFHLPYNPKLKERARELRKNMTEAEKKLTSILNGYGLQVIRFTNVEALKNLEGVCATISELAESPHSPLNKGG